MRLVPPALTTLIDRSRRYSESFGAAIARDQRVKRLEVQKVGGSEVRDSLISQLPVVAVGAVGAMLPLPPPSPAPSFPVLVTITVVLFLIRIRAVLLFPASQHLPRSTGTFHTAVAIITTLTMLLNNI